MTDYINECKRQALLDHTNKMVAAVHEMGHYLVATHINSTILTVTVNYIEWRTSSNGKWCGHNNITYNPLIDDNVKFILEKCKKEIAIALAGKYAERAMFSKHIEEGLAADNEAISRAINIIIKNEPTFDLEQYLFNLGFKLSKTMLSQLDFIAKNALKVYHESKNPIMYTASDIIK